MLRLTKTDSQLAYVVAHELGHCVAQHRRELHDAALVFTHGILPLNALANVTLGTKASAFMLTAFMPFLRVPPRWAYCMPRFHIFPLLALFGPGLAWQYGHCQQLPKLFEAEADRIGLRLMSIAGYEPGSAVGMLQALHHDQPSRAEQATLLPWSVTWRRTHHSELSDTEEHQIWTGEGYIAERCRQWTDVHLDVSIAVKDYTSGNS